MDKKQVALNLLSAAKSLVAGNAKYMFFTRGRSNSSFYIECVYSFTDEDADALFKGLKACENNIDKAVKELISKKLVQADKSWYIDEGWYANDGKLTISYIVDDVNDDYDDGFPDVKEVLKRYNIK